MRKIVELALYIAAVTNVYRCIAYTQHYCESAAVTTSAVFYASG